MKEAVAYVRVSTKHQERSGVGLAGQVAALRAFAEQRGYKIKKVFREAESVTSHDSLAHRPQMRKALEYARKKVCPVIVVALDRVARTAADLEEICHSSGVEFIAADSADPLTLSSMRSRAARVEAQTELLRERTQTGVDNAKRAGVRFGNPRIGEARALAAAANRKNAELRARELKPHVEQAKREGAASAAQIAEALNAKGLRTHRGQPWTGPNLRRVLANVEKVAEADHYGGDNRYGAW
jgi:DNA invertase Pin-like site-specific DNA recombinase